MTVPAFAETNYNVVAADESDVRAVLVGDHPPGVVLLLEYPAGPMKGLGGIGRSYLARLETARQDPTLSTLEKIAKALRVKVATLLE